MHREGCSRTPAICLIVLGLISSVKLEVAESRNLGKALGGDGGVRRCTLPVWKSIGLAADESRRSWSANDGCITRSRNAMRNAEMGAIIVRLRFAAAVVASSVRVRPSRDHSRRFTTEVRIHSAEMPLLWIVLLPRRGDKEPRLAQEFILQLQGTLSHPFVHRYFFHIR